MAKLLKLRRGTTSQHSSFTGAEGELTVDTTKDTAVVHDGSTTGGRPLLREDLDNMPASGVSAGTYGSSSAIPALTVDVKGRVTGATTTAIDSTAITNGSASVAVASNGPITATGNLVVTGTVDGRDVAADGTKLDGIESGATGDQTAAEIRSLVDLASDSNVFTDADHSKLNGIESGATGDQTAAEILTAIKTVDGAGSGLDADLLDGQTGSFYRNASNINSGTINAARLPVINSVPSGAIFIWSGSVAAIPSGYVLCNGSNNTPDLRNRFVVGAGTGSNYTLEDTGGANTITLATGNLPSHSHSTGNHSHGVVDHTHTTPNHSHGVNSHTHSTPNHSHGVNAHSHSTPNHNHNMNNHSHSTNNTGAHSHSTGFYPYYNNSWDYNNVPVLWRGGGNISNRSTNSAGNHSHNTNSSKSNTNSSGGGNTGNAGANTSNSGGSNTGGSGANTTNSGSGTSGAAGSNTTAVSAGTTGNTGSGSSFDNRPPFYALCYIMKT